MPTLVVSLLLLFIHFSVPIPVSEYLLPSSTVSLPFMLFNSLGMCPVVCIPQQLFAFSWIFTLKVKIFSILPFWFGYKNVQNRLDRMKTHVQKYNSVKILKVNITYLILDKRSSHKLYKCLIYMHIGYTRCLLIRIINTPFFLEITPLCLVCWQNQFIMHIDKIFQHWTN
jgi:hypothetical protein